LWRVNDGQRLRIINFDANRDDDREVVEVNEHQRDEERDNQEEIEGLKNATANDPEENRDELDGDENDVEACCGLKVR
jgi:hypothetical protein